VTVQQPLKTSLSHERDMHREATMSDEVSLETDGLRVTMAAWRASVPKAVPYVLPSGADDGASAAVLAAMAHWPPEHATMAADREAAASALHAATGATTAILTAADDEGAAGVTAVSKET
jgi:hypothetical protein